MAILQLLKDKHPKYFGWPSVWRIALLFLAFSIFQSWQQEYKSRVGREKDLVACNHSSDMLRQDLKYESRRSDGINQTLQRQNTDQQGTINGCLSQAMKLLTPVPLEVTAILFHVPMPETRFSDYLVLVNKSVAPVRLLVSCTNDVTSASGMYLGDGVGSMSIGGGRQISPRQYLVMKETGAWTPKNPMMVQVHWANTFGTCSFREEN